MLYVPAPVRVHSKITLSGESRKQHSAPKITPEGTLLEWSGRRSSPNYRRYTCFSSTILPALYLALMTLHKSVPRSKTHGPLNLQVILPALYLALMTLCRSVPRSKTHGPLNLQSLHAKATKYRYSAGIWPHTAVLRGTPV